MCRSTANFSHNRLTGFADHLAMPYTSFYNVAYDFSYNNITGDMPTLVYFKDRVVCVGPAAAVAVVAVAAV